MDRLKDIIAIIAGGADGIGHGLPGGLRTKRGKVIERVVDHAMSERAEGGPVEGIKRFLNGGHCKTG